MFRSKGDGKMALDFSSFEADCRAMGGLFQQLCQEMKCSSSVWQDFISKANKFHGALGVMLATMTAFLDSFQKIADMANNSKGAVRDIGGALTKLCLRQRSVESKLKEFITILGGTFSPIPGLLDDWKKTVIQMDHSHSKEYKKLNNEIQKNLSEASKLKKQVEKGGRAEKLQPSLDSKLKAVEWKYSDLATNECVSLKKLTLHERQRFSFFVRCLAPLLEKQSEILTEAATIEEIKRILHEQTRDPDSVIKCCEDFVDEFRSMRADPQREQQLTFVTPPGTPRCLTRHSSSLSIRSSSSNLNQQKRPHSTLNRQEQGDGQSLMSNSISTTGAFETDSILSQDTLTRSHATTAAAATHAASKTSPGNTSNNNINSNDNDPDHRSDGFIPAPPGSASLTTFGADRRSLMTNSYDSLARKRQSKTQAPPNSTETEDAEFLLAHRGEQSRFFNRGVAIRSTTAAAAAAAAKNQAPFQALDSPVRPGRKNDDRATVCLPSDNSSRFDERGPLRNSSPFVSSGYATLGRSSFKSGSVKANFFGGNYSTGKIGHSSVPTSPPPPPPPLPPPQQSERVEALIKSSSKKCSAPQPPTSPATPQAFPSPPHHENQARNSSFSYNQRLSVAPPLSSASAAVDAAVVTSSSNVTSGKSHDEVSRQNPLKYHHHPHQQQQQQQQQQHQQQQQQQQRPQQTHPSNAQSPLYRPSEVRSPSPPMADIPIRILRKYPDGLTSPSGARISTLEISAPPKPPPPLRNSSMAAAAGEDQGATSPSDGQPPSRQLSRTNSFKQQSAPRDCPPTQKAAPLTIGDSGNNNNNNNNGGNNNSNNSNTDNGNGNPSDITNNNGLEGRFR